jgi:hypothetical protein
VLTGDPHHRLVVADIEDTTSDRDVDIVFGVGIRTKVGDHGYIGLTRDNLIDDVLGSRSSYDPRQVVDNTLPHILSTPGYVPVHKYLRAASELDSAGNLGDPDKISAKVTRMSDRIKAGMPASNDIRRKAPGVLASINSIAELEATYSAYGVLNYGTCMPAPKVDPDELRKFLNIHDDLRYADSWGKTQYVKLVCYLDWLENGAIS